MLGYYFGRKWNKTRISLLTVIGTQSVADHDNPCCCFRCISDQGVFSLWQILLSLWRMGQSQSTGCSSTSASPAMKRSQLLSCSFSSSQTSGQESPPTVSRSWLKSTKSIRTISHPRPNCWWAKRWQALRAHGQRLMWPRLFRAGSSQALHQLFLT